MERSARCVAQSVPATIAGGQAYDAEVRMRNRGSVTWTPESQFQLGTMDVGWGLARGAQRPRAAGRRRGVPIPVTAPMTPGRHRFRWRMLRAANEWFGPPSPQVDVTVTGAGEPAECAALRTQRNELRDLIADLESQVADLPPRGAAAIRAALARTRAQLAALEQRARELGCAL